MSRPVYVAGYVALYYLDHPVQNEVLLFEDDRSELVGHVWRRVERPRVFKSRQHAERLGKARGHTHTRRYLTETDTGGLERAADCYDIALQPIPED